MQFVKSWSFPSLELTIHLIYSLWPRMQTLRIYQSARCPHSEIQKNRCSKFVSSEKEEMNQLQNWELESNIAARKIADFHNFHHISSSPTLSVETGSCCWTGQYFLALRTEKAGRAWPCCSPTYLCGKPRCCNRLRWWPFHRWTNWWTTIKNIVINGCETPKLSKNLDLNS